jgi:hypothetical protein
MQAIAAIAQSFFRHLCFKITYFFLSLSQAIRSMICFKHIYLTLFGVFPPGGFMSMHFFQTAVVMTFLVLNVVGANYSTANTSPSKPPPTFTVVAYSAHNSLTKFNIKGSDNKLHQLSVQRDRTVAPNRAPKAVESFAVISESTFLLLDTYPSIRAGMSFCLAGEEKFLHIISISEKVAKETLALKLASCRENIELAEPGINWDPTNAILNINWLSGPTLKGQSEQRRIKIEANGNYTNSI